MIKFALRLIPSINYVKASLTFDERSVVYVVVCSSELDEGLKGAWLNFRGPEAGHKGAELSLKGGLAEFDGVRIWFDGPLYFRLNISPNRFQ